MQICVSGWHFEPGFLELLATSKYDVHTVSKRIVPLETYAGLPYTVIPDRGLDFGSYSYYLANWWDKKSNVLFCHDDSRILDIRVLDKIAAIDHDVAFIFESAHHASQNRGEKRMPIHGRLIFVHNAILRKFLHDGGIWYDANNVWERLGIGGSLVNMGVIKFFNKCVAYRADIAVEIMPEWLSGYRGKFDYEMEYIDGGRFHLQGQR